MIRDYKLTGNYGTFEITKVVRIDVEDHEATDYDDEDWEEFAYQSTGIMVDLVNAGWTFNSSPDGEEWEIEHVRQRPLAG